jgi:hypothetical protein
MATASSIECTEEIGKTAGEIWKLLSENGPMSLAKLVKTIAEPRDLVMQGIGWLAREDKLIFEDEGRSRIISLRM